MTSVLVVGATSSLAQDFIRQIPCDFSVYSSARSLVNPFAIDLTDYARLPVICQRNPPEYAIIFAGIANINYCQSNPDITALVNVTSIISLVNDLNALGTKCIFLSSSAVFSSTATNTSESSLTSPSCVYGHQKVEVERAILKSPLNSVLRLSKVFTGSHDLIASWFSQLSSNTPVEAFTDLRVSPIPARAVSDYLISLINSFVPGILHLSSNSDLAYSDLAYALCNSMGFPSSLVSPCSVTSLVVQPIFQPHQAYLECHNTASLSIPLNISIQSIFTSHLSR